MDDDPPNDVEAEEESVEGDDNNDDEPDETMMERLWGLTEMIPQNLVDNTVSVSDSVMYGFNKVYKCLRTCTWVLVTSSIILFGPLHFEMVKLAFEHKQQEQFGPCIGKRNQFLRKQGSYPCQPFRPQPKGSGDDSCPC